MKGFAILRVEKIKSAGGVAVALGHNCRERETVNADSSKKDKNQVIGPDSVEKGMSHFRGLVSQDKNPRKNAVLCLEYLITASNKSLSVKDRDAYLNDALKWIRERHGAKNLLQVAVHRDENTDSHLHVLVVPLTLDKKQKPKLNASKWLDGKKKLSEMQTEFAKVVGAKFDLARGVEGSVAKHERVKKFYGMVNEQGQMPQIEVPRPPKLGAFYDLDDWKKNAEKLVFDQIKPTVDALDARSRKLRMAEKELNDTKRTLYKTTGENRKLVQENKELRHLLEHAPIEQIQGFRDEKAKEQQKGRERGAGKGLSH